jgi:hypothetical protein
MINRVWAKRIAIETLSTLDPSTGAIRIRYSVAKLAGLRVSITFTDSTA